MQGNAPVARKYHSLIKAGIPATLTLTVDASTPNAFLKSLYTDSLALSLARSLLHYMEVSEVTRRPELAAVAATVLLCSCHASRWCSALVELGVGERTNRACLLVVSRSTPNRSRLASPSSGCKQTAFKAEHLVSCLQVCCAYSVVMVVVSHAGTAPAPSVGTSPRPHSRAASEATTRGSPVPASPSGSCLHVCSLNTSADAPGCESHNCSGPMAQQPPAKPGKAPAAANQPARKTLKQRLAGLVCCAAPQVREVATGTDDTHDASVRISSTRYIIQPEKGLTQLQSISLHPWRVLGIQELSRLAAQSTQRTNASTPSGHMQPPALDMAAPASHTEMAAGTVCDSQPPWVNTNRRQPSSTPAPALPVPAPEPVLHLSPQAEPTQLARAATPTLAINLAELSRRPSVNPWGGVAGVAESEAEELDSDDEYYWDACSYTEVPSSFTSDGSLTGSVSSRDLGTLEIMPRAVAADTAAAKQQGVLNALCSGLLAHSASTPSVARSWGASGELGAYKHPSASTLLPRTHTATPIPTPVPRAVPHQLAVPGLKVKVPGTVFRADMLPHLPVFERAMQAPRQPYGPHKPLPFLDPDMTYEPIPAVTGYCGYWRKIHERSSPLPMPIDVMLRVNWMTRKIHESIQGIKLSETDKSLFLYAMVRVMGAPVIHKETYMKDGSAQTSFLRRDVKPGRMELRAYWTAGRELVLTVEYYSLTGRLEHAGVEVIKCIDDGETLHALEACYDYNSKKAAVQELVGRRAPLPCARGKHERG